MENFATVAEAGRFIWGSHSFCFRKNPPAAEHINFFRAVLAIASADGLLSTEEKSYAKASAMMNGMSIKDFEEASQGIKKGNVEAAAEEVVRQINATEVLKVAGGRAALYYATLVAGQDGVDAAESRAIHAAAKALGFTGQEVEEAVKCAETETAILKEKKQLLFPSGSKYHTKPTMDFQSIEEASLGFWAHVTFGMTEVPPIELSRAMIRASLAVAIGDGYLSPEESNMAKAVAIVTGHSTTEYNEFVADLDACQDKTKMAVDLLSKVPKEYYLAALYFSCYVAAVDGFDPKEFASLQEVGKALGVDGGDIDKVVDVAARERELHTRIVRSVFPTRTPYQTI